MEPRARTSEFSLRTDGGLLFERLPIGHALERWWLTIVISGIDFSAGESPLVATFPPHLDHWVRVDGVGGDLQRISVGGSGSGGHQEVTYQLRASVPGLRITYVEADRVVGQEEIVLDR